MENYPKRATTPNRLALTHVENISAGSHHSYAITQEGLYGWGSNENLNLGVESDSPLVYEPLFLNIKVNKLATSTRHTFAWNHQHVYGWGSNLRFELGLSEQKPYPITKIPLFDEAAENYIHLVEFSCGDSHSLAIMKKPDDASQPEPSKKVLFGWGNTKDYQLPFDSNKIIPYPVMYHFQKEIDHIYATSDYSVMLSEGGIYSWGTDVFGRLGLEGNSKVQRIPRMVSLDKIVTLGVGKHHVIAVNKEGGAFAWGAGLHGQLGVGSLTNSNRPLPVPLKDFIVEASCGQHHSLLLSNKSQILSSGSNLHGCLGHQNNLDDKKRCLTFQKLNQSGITKICSGHRHNLILSEAGKIYSWGDNTFGQLGLKLMSQMPSDEEHSSTISLVSSPLSKAALTQNWYSRYREFRRKKEEEETKLLLQLQEIMSKYQQ